MNELNPSLFSDLNKDGDDSHHNEIRKALGLNELLLDEDNMIQLDADGNPTTDPNKAAIPTALGGHKGGGLALMFECLTSLMVANPLIQEGLRRASNSVGLHALSRKSTRDHGGR